MPTAPATRPGGACRQRRVGRRDRPSPPGSSPVSLAAASTAPATVGWRRRRRRPPQVVVPDASLRRLVGRPGAGKISRRAFCQYNIKFLLMSTIAEEYGGLGRMIGERLAAAKGRCEC